MTSILIALSICAALVIALRLERHRTHLEAQHSDVRDKSEEGGLNEPASLHPVIDPSRCIGSAACVSSCPEGKVLGIIDGRATLIVGSKCVGHGRCVSECPVDAIKLVFGTSQRGVDIPHVGEHFESNVHGIFIVGELGGMGLVRNAVRQGVEAIDTLARRLKLQPPREEGVFDVVIVGSGPAGAAAAITARKHGLDLRLVDREVRFGGAILHFPRKKLVMTEPFEMPGHGPVRQKEIAKEQLLALLEGALQSAGVELESGREVTSITAEGSELARRFQVRFADGAELRARSVVLAIGRRGMPNRLGVPGEDLGKVTYSLLEPEVFRGQRALVVGGGNSAVEAAVTLAAEPGTEVALSYRRNAFSRVAEKNRHQLDEAVAAGRINLMLESQVLEVAEERVRLRTPAGEVHLDNDAVLVFAGGVAPVEFLRRAGIHVEKKFGEA